MACNLRKSMSVLFAIWITYLATSDSNSNENYMKTRRITRGSRTTVNLALPKYTGEFSSICTSLLSFNIVAQYQFSSILSQFPLWQKQIMQKQMRKISTLLIPEGKTYLHHPRRLLLPHHCLLFQSSISLNFLLLLQELVFTGDAAPQTMLLIQ